MSNEKLAVQIKAGDTACIEQLWQNIYRLLYMLAGRVYTRRRERCAAAGVTLEDLLQECFFVLMRAVDAYDPDAVYPFNAYIRYHMKNTVNTLLGYRTARQQKEPLNTCTSLDMELTGEGDGDLLLGDTIEDPQSEQPFEAVEDAMMYEELRRAVDSLPDRERKIIRYHFYRGLSLKDCTVLLGMHTGSYAGQVKNKALRHLRQNPKIRSMAQYYSDGMKHTSLAFFRDIGMSSVEAAVIKYMDGCQELYREGI